MLAYLQRGGQMVLNIFRPKKKLGWKSFVILGVLSLAMVLATTSPVSAFLGWPDIAGYIASFALVVATFFLKLTIFLLTFIIQIAAYNGYLDSTAVNYGWVMVRDITNMCFVVILLLIAFGTILGLEQYEWKKLMVKFVLAAILVNFSRVICGVVIDIGQVVMVTFINGVAATAGGNLITMFNMDSIMSLTATGTINSEEILMASIAAVGFSALMLGVMAVFMIMLLYRVLSLWILIVLSPLAFVFSVIPTTQKYASEWWQEFGKNVVSGPMVAFFLWLAFVTVGGGNINEEIAGASQIPNESKISDSNAGLAAADQIGQQSAGTSAAMSWTKMANFAIAIGMLLVGAEKAQQLGVKGGNMMSKATDFAKKATMVATGAAAGMWAAKGVYKGAKVAGKWGLMNAPIVGGNAWKRRGLAVQDKALQLGEKFNKKIGSRIGLQFGAHEKIMKERKAAIEVRKGELSSSAKGWEGFQLTGKEGGVFGGRLGGIEDYRAYVDKITGKQMVTKEGSEAYRTSRKAAAQREALENEKTRARFATRTIAQKTEAARLESTKARIELDVVTGALTPIEPISHGRKPEPGAVKADYIKSLADRDIEQNALITTRGLEVTEKGTQIRTEALEEMEKVAPIKELEDSIKELEGVLARIGSGEDAEAAYHSLPANLVPEVDKILAGYPPETANDPSKLKEAIIASITRVKDEKGKNLSDKTLEFGNIKILKGSIDKQFDLLEAIKEEIAKEGEKKGSGNFDGIVKKFGQEDIDQTFGPGTKFDDKFAMSLQNKNLQAAVAALKDIKKQKAESGTGSYSLAAAGMSGIKTANPVLRRSEDKKVTGKIDIGFVGKSDSQSDALMKVLGHVGLDAQKLGTAGLTPELVAQIKTALVKLPDDQKSNLNQSGMTVADVNNLLVDLAGNTELMNALKTRLPSKTT